MRSNPLILSAILLAACTDRSSPDDDTGHAPDDSAQPDDSAPESPCLESSSPILASTIGCVEGRTSEDGALEMFLGVPYAEAPNDALRWARPVARAATDELIDGQSFGDPCHQIGDSRDGELTDHDGREDCLSLNIWRPADANGPLPVLFFIHGGQFLMGSGGVNPIAEDPALAQSAIVVTHNARLGPLGYLAHPAFSAENGGSSGNWGLYDSLLALQWVHDNLDAIGGDPDHVLLFGQESGATAACALMVSPLAEGLFTSVALMSPSCAWYEQELSSKNDDELSAEAQGELFAEAVGCDGDDPATCLRDLTVPTIEAAMEGRPVPLAEGYPWGPIVDGELLPDSPRALVHDGRYTPVPVVAGVAVDEGSHYAGSLSADTSDELLFRLSLAELLKAGGYEGDPTEIVDQYSLEAYGSYDQALSAFYGDTVTHCPTRSMLAALRARGEAHGYVFAWPGSAGAADPRAGDELPYVFGTPGVLEDAQDEQVSQAMRSAFVFTALGWSAIDGYGTWPFWDESSWIWFRGETDAGPGPRDDACDLYDAIDWKTW